MADAFVPLQN